MSSAIPVDPYAGTKIIASDVGDRAAHEGPPPGEYSERQKHIAWLWSYFRCEQYDGRVVDWNGFEDKGPIETQVIASQGWIPPGFYDAGANFPLKFRKPSAPHHIVRSIVNRFTGLLFSAKRRPKIRVEGDPQSEDFVNELARAGNLWVRLTVARNFGGACGSSGVSFKLIRGQPVFEVHNPLWTTPVFKDTDTKELAALDIRIPFEEQDVDARGNSYTRYFLWRRLIDDQADTIWPKVEIDGVEEPDWKNLRHVSVPHGLDECPAVWFQNLPHDDAMDGDPDVLGVHALSDEYDQVMSQLSRATKANSDPTVVVTTDSNLYEVRKGSDNAIKVEKGGTASYLEMSGNGIARGLELCKRIKAQAYELARCSPDKSEEDGPSKTATEVLEDESTMIEQADILREQYGPQLVRLLVLALRICARAMQEREVTREREDGSAEIIRIRNTVTLAPKRVQRQNGTFQVIPRRLGPGGTVTLQWGPYSTPRPTAIQAMSTTVVQLRAAGLLSLKRALTILSDYIPIDDVDAEVRAIEQERKQRDGVFDDAAKGALSGESDDVQIYQYEQDEGAFTLDEIREAKGSQFGPHPLGDGNLTVPEFKAKHANWFKAAAAADEPPEPPPAPGAP